MRVVGYVREAPDPREGEPAFAQSERVRRWAADSGHVLVAVCQDLRTAEGAGSREGLMAVMGIIESSAAKAVVAPELATLSPDKVVQEIILRDLRARGALVVSAAEEDMEELEDGTRDRVRMVVRDVLARLDEHEERFGERTPALPLERDDANVIVELISPEPPEPVERIRPVR